MTRFYSVELIFETSDTVCSDFNWSVSVKAKNNINALIMAKKLCGRNNSVSFRKLYSWQTEKIRRGSGIVCGNS